MINKDNVDILLECRNTKHQWNTHKSMLQYNINGTQRIIDGNVVVPNLFKNYNTVQQHIKQQFDCYKSFYQRIKFDQNPHNLLGYQLTQYGLDALIQIFFRQARPHIHEAMMFRERLMTIAQIPTTETI